MGGASDQESPASGPDTTATGQQPPGRVRWTQQQPPVKVRWTHEQPPGKVRWTHQPSGSKNTPPVGTPGTPSASQPGMPPVSELGHALVTGFGTQPAGEPATPPAGKSDTHVTGRRIVQYLLDGFISSIPAGAITGLLTYAHSVRLILLILIALFVWYGWYWVYRPYRANGQTFGMQWLRVRVISQDGRRARMKQLFIRWLLLIFDSVALGLVGFFAIVSSPDRQRIGDRVAGTLVVRASVQPVPPPAPYSGAGWR
jgi:uncharacterized RDD family membrane protein YckC